MKLKLDADGHVVLQEGKPVYIKDDGREIAFDGKQAFDKIGSLTHENAATRQRAEEAEAKFKPFDGLDADIAKKALDTIRNIDDKKLVDAGKVEEVRAAAVKAYEEKLTAASAQHTATLTELNGKLEKATGELYQEKIGGSFTRSKLITDRFAIPVDLVQARFGSAFKVENGQIVAYDKAGNKIYSPSRAGELADFDEALETLVDQYPYKDQILKGSGASGGGATGGGGFGSKTIGQAAFDALPPKERAAKMADGFTIQP